MSDLDNHVPRYARHFPKAGEAMNKETESGATVPPEMQIPEGDNIDPASEAAKYKKPEMVFHHDEPAPRLLSPAEVREIHAYIGTVLIQQPIDEKVSKAVTRLDRWFDSYETAIAAITALGAWIPLLENIDIRGVQDDADYDEFAAALRNIRALAQQLRSEGE
jgi:hypothetical protein